VSTPPELIAPAGDWNCAKAAVENGADAIYFGLQGAFNARARATNFPADQLPELMFYLRSRGVKGYLTLNTLVFCRELAEFERTVRLAVTAGVDAVIVQDLGAARLVRAICPELPLHASTQMTLTSAECIRGAESLGIERVVLARELSIAQIAATGRQTTVALEVFVHGALCISYSGQCLASAVLGGRSANRGQCAQPCRLAYELICDGRHLDLPTRRYLLSPQDLAAYDLLPDLIAAGVSALKIEGRLKTAEYVANITRCYRTAIDAAAAGRPVDFSPQQIEQMQVSFSRGFSHGYLDGCDHKALVPGQTSAKRGVLLGEVRAVGRGRVLVQLACAVQRGDGLVFAAECADAAATGGRVYEVFLNGQSAKGAVAAGLVELTFGRGTLDWEAIRPGQQVWKTHDPQLARRLRKSYAGAKPHRRVPLDLLVEAAAGRPLRISGRAASGASCRLESPQPLREAVKHPLTADVLAAQLGRLGNTVYQLRHLDARIDGRPMMPLSMLGKLRHEMVRQLDEALTQAPQRPMADEPALARLRATLPPPPAVGAAIGPRVGAAVALPPQHVQLHVLCRSLEQVEAVVACAPNSVMADFPDLRQYEEAVRIAHAAGAAILVATPRIHQPDDAPMFRLLAGCGADGILVRNLAGLWFFGQNGVPLVADFSLNATNELTVQWLHDYGVARVTASYDLSRTQLLDLVAAVPPAWLEVVVHRHAPMFHTQHCIFCAALSPGSNREDCGRPCARHEVRLRDRMAVEHPVSADAGCRNTVFHAAAQSAAEMVPLLVARGIRHFRVELLDETGAAESGRLLALYRDLLGGRLTGREAWGRLHRAGRPGVTRGTLQ